VPFISDSRSDVSLTHVTRRPLLLVALLGLFAGVASAPWWGFVDLRVYRFGGGLVLDGLPLYAAAEPTTGLLFTYPPFAAIAMAPAALVPTWAAVSLMVAGSATALAMTLKVFRVPAAWLVPVTVAALALDPVRETFQFGQVNLLLMAMVSIDLLVLRGRRSSGFLVGIAAGIKLTPLVFVVLLFLTGRRADGMRAVSAFAATLLAGVILLPDDTVAYWTRAVWETKRIGGTEYIRNQALSGTLTRLLHHEPSTAVWLLVAGTAGLALLSLSAASWRRGDQEVGVLIAAGAMLLCSPISWDHHFVWAAPLLVVLWRRGRLVALAAAALLVPGVRALVEHGGGRELTWDTSQQLVGNGYAWLVLCLALLAAPGVRTGQVRVGADPRVHGDRRGGRGVDRPRRAELGDRERRVALRSGTLRQPRPLLTEQEADPFRNISGL
jgi:alpha-1,2-mannosyltransferase